MEPRSWLDRITASLGEALTPGTRWALDDMPHSAQAAVALAVAAKNGVLVFITDGPQVLDTTYRDLRTLSAAAGAGSTGLVYYPAAETARDADSGADPEILGARLEALRTLAMRAPGATSGACVVATCVQALMQPCVPPEALANGTLHVHIGDEWDLPSVETQLQKSGYAFTPQVVGKGQACIRGGLLDAWPPTEAWPLRIELFGTVIESIRRFDPADQRSIDRMDSTELPPAQEPTASSRSASLLSYLPENAVFLWSDPESIREHAQLHEELLKETPDSRAALSFSNLHTHIRRRKGAVEILAGAMGTPEEQRLEFRADEAASTLNLRREFFQPDLREATRQQTVELMRARVSQGHLVAAFFDTQGGMDHFTEHYGLATGNGMQLHLGALSSGFVSGDARVMVVAESDLYGRRRAPAWKDEIRTARATHFDTTAERLSDLAGIEPGDLVVHVDHGLGRYMGLHEIVVSNQSQEVLTIEYDGGRLHVPVAQAHLLSRYVGVSRRAARLHKLGGRRWKNEKLAAETAIADLAATMLETQAQRSVLEGYVFPADTPWQREFESAFPYTETPDQQQVIAAVKRDMQSARPMDRLICGDAGYGKTEVAMRAAFKTIVAGKQTAMLVPTTVLAQQHFETFSDRMSAYPFRIEMLSRFRSAAQRADTIRGLADGTVDIVIGTHALLQPHIRFHDLGLVIIDEEQRFGVANKEQLKRLRSLVDVLTMTATPIPRTLYMSMTGARDMSLMQTPPRERMAIETIVTRNTEDLVREVVLREINREGQVFYLHNRVMTIDRVGKRLAGVVPEARLAIAHGQMPSSKLAEVMRNFADGKTDVLVCTTIIESGVDIPRANTILIDRADRFGIADLYQLRGRVGRSSQKAYAYLLLPPKGLVDHDARKRIAAVRKYSTLSAGFKLALRDLEIRGAGNLLGSEQSGYITAVGFGLYCQLLRNTIARLKGLPVLPVIDVDVLLDFISLSPVAAAADRGAAIPHDYVEDEGLRVATYRQLAEASSLEDLARIEAELGDRFGPPPGPLRRLMKIAEVRVLAHGLRIRRVETRDGRVMLARGHDYIKTGPRFPRLEGKSVDAQLDSLCSIVRAVEK